MITAEKLKHHISHLQDKHKEYEIDCKEAYMHGDDILWENLKKKKLKIKDEIEKCQKRLALL